VIVLELQSCHIIISNLTSTCANGCNIIQECIDAAVSSSRAILDKYNELSLSLADPDISVEDMSKAMSQLETIGDKIEAENLWELDRMVERAMDSLRVPPGDAKTAVLSGGEKRRVSLCQLLLGSHDMLLLDEVRLVCWFCRVTWLVLTVDPIFILTIYTKAYQPS
jgi:ATPase subunit of ABC transporter with duplicated ATPase domains